MEPRSCGNSRRRPTTRSKILKDVYENEGKNRMLRETKSIVDDGFIPRVNDNPDCDLDDETTLKQLRKRFSTKKRERTRSDEIKAVDDESDLNEPLINLKPKRSRSSKTRRKCMNPSDVSSLPADSANKPNWVLKGSDPVICVKVEIPDPEQPGHQNKTTAADEGLNSNETATNEFQNMVLIEYREPPIRGQEYQDNVTNAVQNCVNNEVLDDRVEDAEPISMLVPSDGMNVDSEPLEIESVEFLDLPHLAIQKPNEDQNSNVCIYSRSSSTIEVVSDFSDGPQKKLNFVLFEDKTESDCPFELEDSPSSPDKNCNSSSDSIISSKIEETVLSKEDTIADEERLSSPSFGSPFELEDSPNSPYKNCNSSLDSIISSKIEENVLSKEDTIADEVHLSSPSFESPFELQDSPNSPYKNCNSSLDSSISSKIEENVLSKEDTIADEERLSSPSFESPFELEDSPNSPYKNCNSSLDSIISSKIEENVLSKEDTIADEVHLSSPSFESPFELQDSPNSPYKNCNSSLDSIISSNIEENVLSKEDAIADKEHLSMPSFESHTEGELLKAEEKQASTGSVTDGKSQSSLVNQACNTADIISTPEERLSPENLMSTRKVISPSSEERLCLAMSSVEIWHSADPNKCKEKLFEEQTSTKASSLGSAVQYDKTTVNHRRPDTVRHRRGVISPRNNIKKPQNSKGNIEGPRFSRTLPNLSTDCASIQSCSESAVAFSKQQMHDMESLAVKLMNELKSMKDIVEQKLLFEAYRNVSLKNDADEVKSAINNASKVEETSRKWLSIMSRDCNRFCKIMTMTPNDTSASKDSGVVPRETRKIMFADEAGGELCCVKFFEDGPLSDGVKE